jgi:hypothetical protein
MDLTEDEIKCARESGERIVTQLISIGIDPEVGVNDIAGDMDDLERKLTFTRHQFRAAYRALRRHQESVSSSAPPAP